MPVGPLRNAMQFSIFQKFRLLVLCIFVESIYYILALVPAAMITWLCAVFYSPKPALLAGATLFLVVLWANRPDPIDDRDAIAVAPGSVLHRWVTELSKTVGQCKIHHIVLTEELNASAYVSPGFLGFGARKTLRIGLPLLQYLSSDEVKSVVAHELGHFSRQHDRVGQWIYRVRYKWSIFLLSRRSEQDGFIQSLQKLAARRFIPAFLRQSSAWSHQCEYEADDCAKRAGLAKCLIDALVKMELHEHIQHHAMQKDWVQWKLQSDTPPQNILETILTKVQFYAEESFASTLTTAKTRPLSLYDTHPRLQQRADHLCVAIEPPQWNSVCAGVEAFPDSWAPIFRDYQTSWINKHQHSWCFDHYRMRWLHAEAEANPGDLVLQAVATASLSASTAALDALRAMVATHPSDAYLNYELGRALLEGNHEEGIQHLQTAIRLNKKIAAVALQRISDYHLSRDNADTIERSIRKLDAALGWTSRFIDENLWTRFANEPLEPLCATARNLFRDAISENPHIDGCWVGSLPSKQIDGFQFKINLVIFRMDGSVEFTPHSTEDHMRAHMAHLLETVIKPDELVYVKAVFYTEPMNPKLLQNINRYPGVCITQPQGPVNHNLVRIDVL